jgi:hypothetical protein
MQPPLRCGCWVTCAVGRANIHRWGSTTADNLPMPTICSFHKGIKSICFSRVICFVG